MGSEWPYS